MKSFILTIDKIECLIHQSLKMIHDIWPIVFSHLSSYWRAQICTVSKRWERDACAVTASLSSKHYILRIVKGDYHWFVREKRKIPSNFFVNIGHCQSLEMIKIIMDRTDDNKFNCFHMYLFDIIIAAIKINIDQIAIYLIERYGVDNLRRLNDLLITAYNKDSKALVKLLSPIQTIKSIISSGHHTSISLSLVPSSFTQIINDCGITINELIPYLNINHLFVVACQTNNKGILNWMLEMIPLSKISNLARYWAYLIRDDKLRQAYYVQGSLHDVFDEAQAIHDLSVCSCDVDLIRRVLDDHQFSQQVLSVASSYLNNYHLEIEIIANIKQMSVYDIMDNDIDDYRRGIEMIKKLIDEKIADL